MLPADQDMTRTPPTQTNETEAHGAMTAISAVIGVLIVLALLAWIAFQGRALPTSAPSNALEPPKLDACAGKSAGYFIGRLHGALQRSISWSGSGLKCAGMLRPKDSGMRLLFAENDGDADLLFVLGIPSAPELVLGRELPVNLTIVDEKAERFYNSGETERCWVTISEATQTNAADSANYFLAGDLYCLGALAAINDSGSVTPSGFRFAGYLSTDGEP